MTSNPDHPLSKFSTGSHDTLVARPSARGVDVHQALRDFFNTWVPLGGHRGSCTALPLTRRPCLRADATRPT